MGGWAKQQCKCIKTEGAAKRQKSYALESFPDRIFGCGYSHRKFYSKCS